MPPPHFFSVCLITVMDIYLANYSRFANSKKKGKTNWERSIRKLPGSQIINSYKCKIWKWMLKILMCRCLLPFPMLEISWGYWRWTFGVNQGRISLIWTLEIGFAKKKKKNYILFLKKWDREERCHFWDSSIWLLKILNRAAILWCMNCMCWP